MGNACGPESNGTVIVCPQCLGRQRVSPLAQRCDIPCEACGDTGKVLDIACQCGRPVRPGIFSSSGKRSCGREECDKPQKTTSYFNDSVWKEYWAEKYGSYCC